MYLHHCLAHALVYVHTVWQSENVDNVASTLKVGWDWMFSFMQVLMPNFSCLSCECARPVMTKPYAYI